MGQTSFLLLIAEESNNKVFKCIPTKIQTESEGKLSTESTIKKCLCDSCIDLVKGRYIGIIVRKSFYDKLEEKEDVPAIFRNNDVYVFSKVIIISDKGIEVI